MNGKIKVRKWIVIASYLALTMGIFTLAKPVLSQPAPDIGTSYFRTSEDTPKCANRAKEALQGAGFAEDTFKGASWAFGTKDGTYRGLIECLSTKQVVIVVAGPDKNTVDQLKYEIRDKW